MSSTSDVRSLQDRRVLVMGLGRFGGGVGVTRWLCGQGARVTVTDQAGADSLAESLAQLAGLDVTLRLGGHDEADLAGCDLLVVNPAVAESSPFLRAARGRGVALTTEINLFLSRCAAPVVGITGSVGKSTTTAMTGAVLATRYVTHVGGNIGRSLLEELAAGAIAAEHVVVLELSSFQLQRLADLKRSPHVAAVTNLSPNHLDWHGDMAGYVEAKKNIFRYQGGEDVLVLNADDPAVAAWAAEAPGRVERFCLADEPFELTAPGAHNQANAQAAWAVARAMGVSRDAAAAALKGFRGLPHRLALVAERNGVRYFDDSKATTPAGATVALRSFAPGTVVAVVGGYDKKISLEEFCRELARRCRVVVATGQVGPDIAALTARQGGPAGPKIVLEREFDRAVAAAVEAARPGEAVLLSPGCASYDQFANYIQRGLRFAALVGCDGTGDVERARQI